MPNSVPTADRGQQASATTELVLIMPVVLMVIVMTVQFGLWLHARNVALSAAHEGLAAAQVLDGTADSGRDRAEAFLAETGGIRNVDVSVLRGPDVAEVRVSGTAPTLIPVAGTWPVIGTAEGPVERFVPETDR